MASRSKDERASSLRYFVYVSDNKVEMLLEQIGEPARRSIAAELKLDLKLISLKLTSSAPDRSVCTRSQMAKLDLVVTYLLRHHEVGDLNAAYGYFMGEAEMAWKPCDDEETVLFCGYDGPLLVVLGGSASNLLGRPSSAAQVGSHPYTIRAALTEGGTDRDLRADLELAAESVYTMPEPVRFLARAISRGQMPDGSRSAEYLLATPLYVEAIDAIRVDQGESVPPRIVKRFGAGHVGRA